MADGDIRPSAARHTARDAWIEAVDALIGPAPAEDDAEPSPAD